MNEPHPHHELHDIADLDPDGLPSNKSLVKASLVALAIADSPWFLPSWQSIAVIAWITLIPMCIGNVCWFAIVGLLPANVAGLSSVMVPVVAMVSGAIVHGEPLGPLQLVSMVSCVAALVLALGHKTRPATREG